MSDTDDHSLLARVAEKDRRAFEALYHRYYGRLFGYVLKITRRPDLVEEVVNDVMFVVWRDAGRFRGQSKPSSWILGIACRKALKALSGRKRTMEPLSRALDQEAPGEGPELLAVRRQEGNALAVALGELSAEQRAVLELAYAHGYSCREIATLIGCPVGTVKTRMFHARRRLRELLPELDRRSHAGQA